MLNIKKYKKALHLLSDVYFDASLFLSPYVTRNLFASRVSLQHETGISCYFIPFLEIHSYFSLSLFKKVLHHLCLRRAVNGRSVVRPKISFSENVDFDRSCELAQPLTSARIAAPAFE